MEVRSLSQDKRDEALSLEAQAHELERRQPQHSITVQGDTVEELVKGVISRPTTMAPPLASIA
jgi:hypothetical protein